MFCFIKKLPLSSTVAVSFYIPTNSKWESFVSTYLPTFATVSVLNFDCYNRYVVVSFLFYLEIHWWHMLLSIFFMLIFHLFIFFGEVFVHVFYPFFNCFFFFFIFILLLLRFSAAQHGLQDLSSLTRDWTWLMAVKAANTKSLSLDHQGIPLLSSFKCSLYIVNTSLLSVIFLPVCGCLLILIVILFFSFNICSTTALSISWT